MIKLSVVVPTYRRNDLLRRCLDALVTQYFPVDEYEVIVADNAGDAATAQLVADFDRRETVRVRYVRADQAKGPAAARNRGWCVSAASIIAFTDDDCVPDAKCSPPDWPPLNEERMP